MTENFNIEKRMFNSSCISDYMGCPRLFYYSWIRKITTKEEKPSLTFGKVFHEVLLEWYKSGDVEKAIIQFDKIPSPPIGEHLTREWGTAVFKEYVERYKTEIGKTLHLEVKFRVEIGNKIYAGTIDRIEDWGGQVYVDDHKTTKSLGLSFFEMYRPHPQIDGYCYACREVVGKCQGAIINGISTAKNPKERFQRFPSSRTDKEMDRWVENFTDVTDEIVRDVERNHFPMSTTYCHRWGKCKFWEICVYGEEERMMEQNYVSREKETEENNNE